MDLVTNLRFNSDGNEHVCEVQFVHKMLLTVREGLGGHAVYNKFRSAMELLEVHGVIDETTNIVVDYSEIIPTTLSTEQVDALSNELISFLTTAKIKVTDQLTTAFNSMGIVGVDDFDDLDEEMTAALEDAMKPMEKKRFRKSLVGRKGDVS